MVVIASLDTSIGKARREGATPQRWCPVRQGYSAPFSLPPAIASVPADAPFPLRSPSASAGHHDPALSVRDLTFTYRRTKSGSGEHSFTLALPRLSLGPTEEVLLTGGSGTGKSTLLQLIAGLLDPDSGSVMVRGTDVHGLRGAARDRFRGRTIGMVFQTFHLAIGFSALENVLLALLFGDPAKELVPNGHRARAASLLEALGIERLDAPVETLSVGQQQRVAVARALACQPAIVLADEPTASLDPDNAARAVDLLQSTCRQEGAALLVVSHDPSLVGRFERTIALGSVVANPDPAERAR